MNKNGAIIIEGHVQGLSNTRSLGEKGIPVIVVDTNNCVARYSKYCKEFFKCPPYNSDALADFLIEIAVKKELKDWILIPSNDHAVLTISRNKNKLEKHFKIITPGLDVIENIYDKTRLIELAVKADVPVPSTFCFESKNFNEQQLPYPLLIKGRQGLDFFKATGKKAFYVANQAELNLQIKNISNVLSINKILIQEVIPDNKINKTISFTAFCVNGEIKTYWMGIKLREHPVRFGTATLAKSLYIEDCYHQSVPLLKILNYTGVCEIEYLQDPRDKKYKLIEMNARTWLWVSLAKFCGVDYAKIMYDSVNDANIQYPEKYDLDKYWINPFTDFVYKLIEVFKGNISLEHWIIFKRKKVNALFTNKDFKPGLFYLFNMFPFIIHR